MKCLVLFYCLFIFCTSYGQAPAVLQWQKSYGGSLGDEPTDLVVLADGSIVLLSSSSSDDGDMIGNASGPWTPDISVLKLNPAGDVVWQRTFGGTLAEISSSIITTTDGGFAFIGTSTSNDRNVTGNHGMDDVWVVKLNATGNMLWQKSFGGTKADWGSDIIEVDNGYMITGVTRSGDGDVSGNHSVDTADQWVLNIDHAGVIIWQRCYGGSGTDGGSRSFGCKATIRPTTDGNFIIMSITSSRDGDVSNPLPQSIQDAWVIKISKTGAILWNKCVGGQYGDVLGPIIIHNDGTYTLAGYTYSKDLPGSYGPAGGEDGWVLKLDTDGNTIWVKAFGGTDADYISSIHATPDGGFLFSGATKSNDGIVCKTMNELNMWIVKLTASGVVEWSRTLGGNKEDFGMKMLLLNSSEALVVSASRSSDGDVTINKGLKDIWLTRVSFTGILLSPSITIRSEKDSTACSGKNVYFLADIMEGGTQPVFQWKRNGMNVGSNSDTLFVNDLQSTDVISVLLTSNSPCVDKKTAVSNELSVEVVAFEPPKRFLATDTTLCSFEQLTLQPDKEFTSYLWSTNSTERSITVKAPGIYWLQVTDGFNCIGTDSITITPKACVEGVFVPNAFSPNNDGLNDIFMPIMHVDVKQYRFVIYGRWGNVLFETTNPKQGWDGKYNGVSFNTGVYIWLCTYQLEGEATITKKGTVMILR